MKINKLIIGALAVLSFAACSNDDIVPDTPEQPSVSKYEQLTFSSADEPSTRAVWADPNGSGSLVFNWEDDDYLDRVEITDCMGRCTASGDTVTCIGETLYLRKKCNGHESSGPISEL